MTEEVTKISTKDLKKGITYYLNYEYNGWGGQPVRFVSLIKTSPYKGCVKVVHPSGVEFLVHKNSWLFGEDPEKK
jgi:hypothetical protein